MRIGELSKAAKTGLETVRFYERQGLLPAQRSDNGYREFGPDALDRLRFIARARDLGFSLTEIGELLALRLDPGATRADVRRRTQAKLDSIEAKLQELQAMREALSGLLDCCHGKGKASDCPILDSLSRPGPAPRKKRRQNF
jgi:MerR family mercuric resistance operon transcriptional regulator